MPRLRQRIDRKLFKIQRNDGSVYFQVDFRTQRNRRIRRFAGTVLTEAKRLRDQIEYEVRNDIYVEPNLAVPEDPTVAEFVARFIKEQPGSRRSDHYPDTTKYLVRDLGTCRMRDVDRARLEAFVAHLRTRAGLKGRKLGDSSVRKIVSVAKTVFKTALRWGILANDPSALLKKPPEPVHRTRYLSREEWQRLKEVAPRQLRDWLVLSVHTGMRLKEIACLRWPDVDLVAGVVTVPRETKTGRRQVPLNQSARQVLEGRRPGVASLAGYVFVDARGHDFTSENRRQKISRNASSAMKAVGIFDATFHTLRHTAASWMVGAGVPLYEVQAILGHSTPMLTQRYAHLAPGQLKRAVMMLDGLDSPGTPAPDRAVTSMEGKRRKPQPAKQFQVGRLVGSEAKTGDC